MSAAGWAGVDLDAFPALKAWEEKCTLRPGFEEGRHVPTPHTIRETARDKDKLAKAAEEAKTASSWIMKGMAEDAKKSGDATNDKK